MTSLWHNLSQVWFTLTLILMCEFCNIVRTKMIIRRTMAVFLTSLYWTIFYLKLWELRQSCQYLLRHEMNSSMLRSEMKFPLEPRVWSDGQAGAGGVAGHHARLAEGRRGRPWSVLRWGPEMWRFLLVYNHDNMKSMKFFILFSGWMYIYDKICRKFSLKDCS